MKILLLSLFLAGSCLASEFHLVHRGFTCPGADHQSFSTNLSPNPVAYYRLLLSAYNPHSGDISDLTPDTPIDPSNYLANVEIVGRTNAGQDFTYIFTLQPRYPDECMWHTNDWLAESMGLWGDNTGISFNRTNLLDMGKTPADNRATAITSSWTACPDCRSLTRLSEQYLEPLHPIEVTPQMRPLPVLKPPWDGNWNNAVTLEMVAHANTSFALYTSATVDGSWTSQDDLITDEYGWVSVDLTNLPSDQLFFKLSYTNAP